MTGPEVLVTDGANGTSRDTVCGVRALAAGGFRPVVTVTEERWWTAPSKYVARRIVGPSVFERDYADFVRLHAGRHVAVLITSEAAQLALAGATSELHDKRQLSGLASHAGLDTPDEEQWASVNEMREASAGFRYPVVVKPVAKSFRPFKAVSARDLEGASLPDGEVIVQEHIDAAHHAICGVMWKGRIHSACHEAWGRTWPPECGLLSTAETIERDRHLESGLERLMSGYEGIFSAQFLGTYLIDLNLRSYSSLSLAVAAGANLAAIAAGLSSGLDVAPASARPGVRYRWIAGDVKAVAWALRHGRMSVWNAAVALRPRLATSHSLFSAEDLRPMAGRIIDGYLRRHRDFG